MIGWPVTISVNDWADWVNEDGSSAPWHLFAAWLFAAINKCQPMLPGHVLGSLPVLDSLMNAHRFETRDHVDG